MIESAGWWILTFREVGRITQRKNKTKTTKTTTNNRNPTTIDHKLKTIISITKTWLTFPNSTQTKYIQFYLFTNDGRHQYFVSLKKTKISCAGFLHINKKNKKKFQRINLKLSKYFTFSDLNWTLHCKDTYSKIRQSFQEIHTEGSSHFSRGNSSGTR